MTTTVLLMISVMKIVATTRMMLVMESVMDEGGRMQDEG